MKKIQIVEDEVAIAMDLEMNLEMLGYEVSGHAVSYDEAIELYSANKPDLVLMDINLHGEKTGIDVANWINKNNNTPVVFLTAFNDSSTVNSAINSEPYGYIVKPFTTTDLRIHIEIALKKAESLMNSREYFRAIFEGSSQPVLVIDEDGKQYYENIEFAKLEEKELEGLDKLTAGIHSMVVNEKTISVEVVTASLGQDYRIVTFGSVNDSEWAESKEEKFLFVKDKSEFHRIMYSEILALEALDNYTKIYTLKGKYTIHGYLSDFEAKLDEAFVRIHRSHIVALNKVDKVDGFSVICGSLTLPISRTKRENLLGLLKG